MARTILLPIDPHSEAIERSIDVALDLFEDSTLVLLHVVNPAEVGYGAEPGVPSISQQWYENEKEQAEAAFDDIAERAEKGGCTVERRIEVGKPTRVILDIAAEEDVDHIVMGSHGRKGVSRLLLGSVAEGVVRRAERPVTIAR